MKNRRDAARRLRYQRGLCIHCPGKRDTKSTRCAACREKATAYERARRATKSATQGGDHG
jgi:hypothetical protein